MKIFEPFHAFITFFFLYFSFPPFQIFYFFLLPLSFYFRRLLSIVCNWHTQGGKQAINNRLIIHFRMENRMARTGIM